MVIIKIDSLGRVILPSEIRKKLNLENGNELKISLTKDNKILIEKPIKECFCCNSSNDLITYQNISLCKSCITKFN